MRGTRIQSIASRSPLAAVAAAIGMLVLFPGGRVPAEEPVRTEDHGHSLGLSDEAIPYEKFGECLPARQETVTEVIDDTLFPENKARKELLQARPVNDMNTDIPERRSLFGRDRFLSPGPVDPGKLTATGALLRPSFLAFGSVRSALQAYEAPGELRTHEWVNRLDLFGNFYFSGTERILIGFRPLDREGNFTGVSGNPGRGERFNDGFNIEPTTLYFEGYLDEIFPRLDPNDRRGLDYGISIGRQPIFLQDGILANDSIDSIGITRHNLFRFNASASRISFFAGFNDLHRNDNLPDSSANFYAVSGCFDYPGATWETDLAYVTGDPLRGGDALFAGVGRLAQAGYWHSGFRANASFAMNSRKSAAVSDGWLLTHQLSRTMRHSDDILTFSTFYEIDNYTSAARNPDAGGPLGGFNLLHRAVGIGTYGPPIVNDPGDQIGGGVSYQHFFDSDKKKQLLAAAGGIHSTIDDSSTTAVALQYQQALSGNLIWILGGFGSITDQSEKGFGMRTEIFRKF